MSIKNLQDGIKQATSYLKGRREKKKKKNGDLNKEISLSNGIK